MKQTLQEAREPARRSSFPELGTNTGELSGAACGWCLNKSFGAEAIATRRLRTQLQLLLKVMGRVWPWDLAPVMSEAEA